MDGEQNIKDGGEFVSFDSALCAERLESSVYSFCS